MIDLPVAGNPSQLVEDPPKPVDLLKPVGSTQAYRPSRTRTLFREYLGCNLLYYYLVFRGSWNILFSSFLCPM